MHSNNLNGQCAQNPLFFYVLQGTIYIRSLYNLIMPKIDATTDALVSEIEKRADDFKKALSDVNVVLDKLKFNAHEKYTVGRMLEMEYRHDLTVGDIRVTSILLRYTKKPREKKE